MQEVVPRLEEVGLLRDALKQLDQPFLVVVVGEFNSGKSTVINALLGKRFLAEGILPTTNEISVLKFRSGTAFAPAPYLIGPTMYWCGYRAEPACTNNQSCYLSDLLVPHHAMVCIDMGVCPSAFFAHARQGKGSL